MSSSRSGGGRFPLLGLLTLAGAIFVSVTAEFLPTGLLPDMAGDLDVSVSEAGLLVSVFAGTVVVATAPLAALTRTVSRKRLVVLVLAINAFATLLASIAPDYPILLGARVLGGLAHGLFWAVVGSYAAHLVPREQLARAIAVTGAGGSAAFVLGVPLGTALGHGLGWRLAFGAIAAVMVLLTALVMRFLPPVDHEVPTTTGEIPIPTRKDPTLAPVLVVCATIVLVVLGQNILYTYVAPFVTERFGVDAGAIGPLLFLYGGAGVIGLVLAGIVGDRYPVAGIAAAALVSAACVCLLGAFPGTTWLAVIAIVAWGLAMGALPALLQTRNMQVASPRIRDLAAAWMTTAFNVGIGGGAAVGAVVVHASGLAPLPWLTAIGMITGAALLLLLQRPRRTEESGASVIV